MDADRMVDHCDRRPQCQPPALASAAHCHDAADCCSSPQSISLSQPHDTASKPLQHLSHINPRPAPLVHCTVLHRVCPSAESQCWRPFAVASSTRSSNSDTMHTSSQWRSSQEAVRRWNRASGATSCTVALPTHWLPASVTRLLCVLCLCRCWPVPPPPFLGDRMAWYFGMCLLMNLALGVWGSVNVDMEATGGIPSPSQRETCSLINTFLVTFSTLSVEHTDKTTRGQATEGWLTGLHRCCDASSARFWL